MKQSWNFVLLLRPPVVNFFPGVISFQTTTLYVMHSMSNFFTYCAMSCADSVNVVTYYVSFCDYKTVSLFFAPKTAVSEYFWQVPCLESHAKKSGMQNIHYLLFSLVITNFPWVLCKNGINIQHISFPKLIYFLFKLISTYNINKTRDRPPVV